jgi:hypothetical protein
MCEGVHNQAMKQKVLAKLTWVVLRRLYGISANLPEKALQSRIMSKPATTVDTFTTSSIYHSDNFTNSAAKHGFKYPGHFR